ncbi:hypothetical protein EIN_312020 [Entamoeba invadens IP1]|uniref:Uncharacterized protein n=1 Tax=Entamoeba invadens IP1 TaxID=370355 RepID=A0A0A1TUU7_ENTIV|nr:hypothetical protein EIN_312020 [Entamoeba invadens IP1]ELP83931.1 hypothetical protein EIN_312020 [Entamoeba invadens IP1]|eukprot:XP_004183277.1 hypothetical protein EIN_312020 [Entamoeba invadens IP1]
MESKETGPSDVFSKDENGIRKLDLEYGDFPDDGYDYSKHFAERGWGVFVQQDGKILQPENRGEDTINKAEDIPDDIDPEILAMLNEAEEEGSDNQFDENFLEKNLSEFVQPEKKVSEEKKEVSHKDLRELRAIDKEFEQTLNEWDDDGDEEYEKFDESKVTAKNHKGKLEFEDDEEFSNDSDENAENAVKFPHGNPIDDIDFDEDYLEIDDNDVKAVIKNFEMTEQKKNKKNKKLAPQRQQLTREEKFQRSNEKDIITPDDLIIDPKIILQQAERMEREEDKTEKVVITTVITDDILQHHEKEKIKKAENKNKKINKPKIIKTPVKKTVTKKKTAKKEI